MPGKIPTIETWVALTALSLGACSASVRPRSEQSFPGQDPSGPECGDGRIEGDEECDRGDANGQGSACSQSCTVGGAACGAGQGGEG